MSGFMEQVPRKCPTAPARAAAGGHGRPHATHLWRAAASVACGSPSASSTIGRMAVAKPLAVPSGPRQRRSRRAPARAVEGDVLFDAGSRGRYATDASIYQVEPVGVLVPKSADDVRAAIAICREHGVPVLPRGAGSSQCGQTVGAALVIDPSKHLARIVAFRPRGDDGVGVEPGVVLDPLNACAEAARAVVPGRRQHVGAGDARRHGRQQFLRLALDRLRQHGAQRARDRRHALRRHRGALRPRARDGRGAAARRRAPARAARDRRARARRDRAQRAEGPAARRRLQHRRLLRAERAAVHPRRQRQLRASARRQRRHARLVARAHAEARAAAGAPRARRRQLPDAVQGDGERAAPRRAAAVGGRARRPDDDRPRARQPGVPRRSSTAR